jgi:RNA polymerase sigma-70 factor (ECF subfamily)
VAASDDFTAAGGEAADPAEPDLGALLDRFAAAFTDADMTALAALLTDDVALEMPPLATWFSGRETVLGYLASTLCAGAGRSLLVSAAANGQPAFAAYLRDADGVCRAHAMIVLTLTGAQISRVVIFLDPALFRLFGLGRELAPGDSGPLGPSMGGCPGQRRAAPSDARRNRAGVIGRLGLT